MNWPGVLKLSLNQPAPTMTSFDHVFHVSTRYQLPLYKTPIVQVILGLAIPALRERRCVSPRTTLWRSNERK